MVSVADVPDLKVLRSYELFVPETIAVAMQSGVVTRITDLLAIELRPKARERLAESNTAVLGAYEFYSQGFGYLTNWTMWHRTVGCFIPTRIRTPSTIFASTCRPRRGVLVKVPDYQGPYFGRTGLEASASDQLN
jgi:hypothetical protein